MAKNYNAAFGGINTTARRQSGSSATTALLSGFDFEMDKVALPVENIELSKIHKRPVNRYHMVDNIELDESIRKYGLINPIAVCHQSGEDSYTISAGERRFEAVSRLHERYPDNPRFKTIECKVYIITEDTTLLEQGFPYITAEQEEGIYRDSNNLARQLSEKDIASQIRYIVQKFDDPEYVQMLRDTAKLAGFKTYSNPDKAVLISSVMQSQGLWKKEKIRQYLIVYNSHNDKLLDAIEDGEISVYAAYKQIVDIQNRKRKRKTNKIQHMFKTIDELVIESKTQNYSLQDIGRLKECISKLQKIVDENTEI